MEMKIEMEIDEETLKNGDGDGEEEILKNRFLVGENFLILQIPNNQNGGKMDVVVFLKSFLFFYT